MRGFALGALASLGLLSSVGFGASFSFTGSFSQDDQLQLLTFVISSPATVILETWSYGGGTNSAGQLIPDGGFYPVVSVFDSAGVLVGPNIEATCPPHITDPLTGACWDSGLSLSLSAGTYTVALTQYNNFPNGPFFSDGFSAAGRGNFTCLDFTGSPGSFCDLTGALRTSEWALDIVNVDNAFDQEVPEPAVLGAVAGLIATGIVLRRAAKRG